MTREWCHRGSSSSRTGRGSHRWHSKERNGYRDARKERNHRSDRYANNGWRGKDDRESRCWNGRRAPAGSRWRRSRSRDARGSGRHGGDAERRRGGSPPARDGRDARNGRRQERRSRSRRWSPRGGRHGDAREARRGSDCNGSGRWQEQRHDHGVNGRGRDRGSGHRGASERRSPATSEYSSSSDSRASSDDSRKKKKSGDSDKDEIVHFSWQKGMLMNQRYKMVRLLGDGTFGRVLLAQDQRENREVAIKVIRDVKRYAENAKIEADILKDIRRVDPRGESSRSAIMYDTFSHGRHFCLVFEPCGVSLYDFLKNNSFRGFWMQDIQSFARQCLEALGFLHSKLQMTHTDLKPENILLECMDPPRQATFPRESTWQEGRKSSKSRGSSGYVRPANSQIRLIDFGNATYEDEHHSSVINTRQYRGPEVILALGWNERSDVWSLGCIFMELYTGELLFGTHENLEHLALMERVLEPLPASMLSSAPKGMKEKYTAQSRDGQLRLHWPESAQSSASERHVHSQRPLAELVAPQHVSFAEFVGKLLTLDPQRRPSASEASRHSFFSKHFGD